jgi:hypothetical protein
VMATRIKLLDSLIQFNPKCARRLSSEECVAVSMRDR